jgi:O-antigen ligase
MTSWLTRDQWPLLLVWSCLLVLPIGRIVEVPVMIMAIAGLVLLFKNWRTWRHLAAFKLFCAVFLLAWVPILISLVDAVRPESTVMMSLNHLRFAFSGIFILYALSTPDAHRRFMTLCAWLLLFWLVDGVVQMVAGRDLFGFATPEIMPGVERINALFGKEGLVYATVVTVFCPLLWEHARRHWAPWQTVAVVFTTILIALVAGTRSAWINIAVLMSAYAVLVWIYYRRVALRITFLATLAIVVTITGLWFGSRQFENRLTDAIASSPDSATLLENSIGHRYWIGRGAVNMIRANPVNGVGAGGFRYAFPDYAEVDDPFFHADPPHGAYHSHNVALEILSESGIIGAGGLLALLTLLIVAAARAPAATRQRMLPYGLCLLVAYFPINSHMAIYSSFWSQILWWLIALYCAAYGAARKTESPLAG